MMNHVRKLNIYHNKTLVYLSFAIASLLIIATFVTAKTYTQLGIAVVFYPLLTLFAYKLFVGKDGKEPVIAFQLPSLKRTKVAEVETPKVESEDVSVTDIEKRAFLKLIGAAGISFFLFSLFNRRSEGLFFGRAAGGSGVTALTDGAGNKIDPAERQPTDGYRISEIDDNDTAFYGFTGKNGAWFIMKEESDTGSFRYSKGESNFSVNWTNRKDLQYDYFHYIFKG